MEILAFFQSNFFPRATKFHHIIIFMLTHMLAKFYGYSLNICQVLALNLNLSKNDDFTLFWAQFLE